MIARIPGFRKTIQEGGPRCSFGIGCWSCLRKMPSFRQFWRNRHIRQNTILRIDANPHVPSILRVQQRPAFWHTTCSGICGRQVLACCANPGCNRRFRNLQEGKLFLMEVTAAESSLSARQSDSGRVLRNLKHYWLCDDCSSILTLSFDQERGVLPVPLARHVGKKPALSVHSEGVAGNSRAKIEAAGHDGKPGRARRSL